MKKTKTVVCSALAAVLAVSALSGCGDKNSGKSDSGKTKMSYAGWTLGPVNENSYVEQELEKKFPDVDFELIPFERSTWVEQISTRIAGGDCPDIIYRDDPYYIREGSKQGIIAEVPFSMVRECAKEVYDATLDYGTDVWYATYYQGKNYGLPIMQPHLMHGTAVAWRADWLKKVGIDKVPETIGEFEEALTKFVNEDPDGNGQKDTLGISIDMKTNGNIFPWVIAAFAGQGKTPATYFVKDGKAEYPALSEEFKEGMTLLRKWYKAGLVDPEFITSDSSTLTSKWSNGKLGCFPSYYYGLIEGGSKYEALKAVDKNAEVVLGPVPTGPKGQNEYYKEYPPAVTSSVTFGKHLEKDRDKLKKAVSIVNTMMSDKELYGKVKYGEEGKHWTRSEKTNEAMQKDGYKLQQDRGDVGNNIFEGFFGTPSLQTFYGRNDLEEILKYENPKTQENRSPRYMGANIDSDIMTSCYTTQDKMRAIMLNYVVGKQDWDAVEAYKDEYIAGAQKLINARIESEKSDIEAHKAMLKDLGVETE